MKCSQCGHEARFHDMEPANTCRVGDELGNVCGCIGGDELEAVDELEDDERAVSVGTAQKTKTKKH